MFDQKDYCAPRELASALQFGVSGAQKTRGGNRGDAV